MEVAQCRQIGYCVCSVLNASYSPPVLRQGNVASVLHPLREGPGRMQKKGLCGPNISSISYALIFPAKAIESSTITVEKAPDPSTDFGTMPYAAS